MNRIKYTDHLKLRLKVRRIPEAYPETIYRDPEERYYDTEAERNIAVKRLYYNGKVRPMMIAYDEKDDVVEIVTVHPITEEKIINRRINGRWIER